MNDTGDTTAAVAAATVAFLIKSLLSIVVYFSSVITYYLISQINITTKVRKMMEKEYLCGNF